MWEAMIEAASQGLPAKHTDDAGKAYLAKIKLKASRQAHIKGLTHTFTMPDVEAQKAMAVTALEALSASECP